MFLLTFIRPDLSIVIASTQGDVAIPKVFHETGDCHDPSVSQYSQITSKNQSIKSTNQKEKK